MYVRNTYKFKLRHCLAPHYEGEFESLLVEATRKNNHVIVGEIYRVPNTNEVISIKRHESTLNNIKETKISDVIIGTDQNFDYLKISEQQNIADLLELYISNGYIPTATRPTRISHSSATLIDNIYTTLKSNSHIQTGIITTDISDHLPVFTFIGTSPKQPKQAKEFEYRDLSDGNVKIISNFLRQIDWTYLNNLDANEAYSDLIEKLTNIMDTVTPNKTIKIPAKRIIREPWITRGIIKSSSTCDKLYKKQSGHIRQKKKDMCLWSARVSVPTRAHQYFFFFNLILLRHSRCSDMYNICISQENRVAWVSNKLWYMSL